MSDDDTPHRKLAVALEYEKGTRNAPRVVAKGHGLIAEAIIAKAVEHGIVVDTNAALAQALAGVELDDTIPIELYEAVAEVIGFVLRARSHVG
jgi:FlhB-like protein